MSATKSKDIKVTATWGDSSGDVVVVDLVEIEIQEEEKPMERIRRRVLHSFVEEEDVDQEKEAGVYGGMKLLGMN